MSDSTTLEVVSHAQDGRVLSGVGVDAADLAKVMERHAPPKEPGHVEEAPASEPGVTAPAAEPAAASPAVDVPDKKTRGQKRFDQLTGEREAEARARQAAEKERDEFKARLEALEQRQAPQGQSQQPQGQQPAAQTQGFQLPAELQDFPQFLGKFPQASYDDYLTARAVYANNVNFDARIRDRIEADRAARSFQDRVAQVAAKAREVFPDFDAVVTTGPGQGFPFIAQTDAPEIQRDKTARFHAVFAHPQSHTLQYMIAKDAALAQRLATCSPFDFGRELDRLIPGASAASTASTDASGSATPPAPYQPVGSGSKTTTASSAELVKAGGFDFDKSGYRERRAAERGVTRRR